MCFLFYLLIYFDLLIQLFLAVLQLPQLLHSFRRESWTDAVTVAQEQRDRSQSNRQFGHFDAASSANSTRIARQQLPGRVGAREKWSEQEEGQGSWSARDRDRGRGEACYHKIGVNELQSPFWRRHCQLIGRGGQRSERDRERKRLWGRREGSEVLASLWNVCNLDNLMNGYLPRDGKVVIILYHSTPLHSLVSFLCFIFALGFVFLFLFFPSWFVASFYQLYIAHFAPFRRLPSMTEA